MENAPHIVLETEKNSSSFHFEAGRHTYLPHEYQEQQKQIMQGHLDTHFWQGDGLRERITSYGFNAPALILGIDSLEPFVFNQDKGMDWRTLAWYELPARPRELHQTGEVYVVRFDVLGDHMMQHALWTGKSEKIPDTILQQQENFVKQEQQHVGDSYYRAIFTEDATIMAFAATLATLISSRKNMSRRNFLKNGIRFATAGAVGSWLSDWGRYAIQREAGFASDEETEQWLLTVNNILQPRLPHALWMDGRTARGIRVMKSFAKQMRFPEGTQSAVLFGSNHVIGAQDLIEDDVQTDKIIGAFAEELLDAAKSIYATYYHISPQRIPQQFTTNLLDYFTHVDMLAVSDPGGPNVQPHFFEDTLPKHLAVSKPIHSPELEKAIEHLRPQ